MRFLDRLRSACEEGVLIGVKLALAVGFVLIGVSYILADYGLVRERARNGQAAYELLQRQLLEKR